MTNTMASNHGKILNWSKPISSAYVVMLRRHLLRLQDQQRRLRTIHVDFSSEIEDQVFALEHISPLLHEIERLSGYACFGLDIGTLMHPSDYGIFGYAMMNCETLKCALRTACDHKNMLNREFTAEFISDDDHVIYKVNTAITSKELQILIELDFSTAFEFSQRLVGPYKDELSIKSVHFTHRPLGPIDHYLTRFKCPVHFNASENKIVIEKEMLDTPIYGANPKVLSLLEDKIGNMTRYAQNDSNRLKHMVSRYVKEQLGGELPSAQSAAQHFNMSLSAFKKRLHIEGACYQLICDEVRYRRCRELMQKSSIAIKEIAFNLGFTNASAFNRAFKRWTGESPSGFKKRSSTKNQI